MSKECVSVFDGLLRIAVQLCQHVDDMFNSKVVVSCSSLNR